MVGQGEKYNAGRIPQREASRLKWLDKDEKYNAGRIPQREASRLKWLDKERNITLGEYRKEKQVD